MSDKIILNNSLMKSFVCDVKNKYPKKSFGYFIADKTDGQPKDYIIFQDDVRNDMKEEFESYGNYYTRNEDAGFLASQEEIYHIHKKIIKEGRCIVGVFHSHQRHPAIFSKVDIDFHPSKLLWHLIISLRNTEYPEIKIFKLNDKRVIEIPFVMEEINNEDC